MTRRAVLPPTDTERVLTGWPRCPGERFGPDADDFDGCGAWSSPCAEHLARDLYETAVSATCYGTGVLNLLVEPRHLGWKKIEGEDGKRALRRLRELRQRHDPNASELHAYLLAARRERRAGRAV